MEEEDEAYDIFISYSHQDNQFVDRLVNDLSKEGFSVFIDRDAITAGDLWSERIVEAINNSKVFIIVLSPSAAKSEYVERELALAQDRSKRIIPIVYEAGELPPQFLSRLARIQAVHMESDNYSSGFRVLSDAIKRTLGEPISVGTTGSDLNQTGEKKYDPKDFSTTSSSTDDGGLDVQTFYQGKPVASTIIRLDGDTSAVMPVRRTETGSLELDQYIYSLHEKNVNAAIASRGEQLSKQLAAQQEAVQRRLQAAIEANRLTNNRSQALFADNEKGEDQLGIKNEIYALAETLLLRDVQPPLTVGIMGSWGSGKSFVMSLIQEFVSETRTQEVKKGWPDKKTNGDAEVPSYVGHIYQIEFNAWHYAKSNLWASIMDTIFSDLNRQMQLEQLLAHRECSSDNAADVAEEVRKSLLAGGDVFKRIYGGNFQIDQEIDLQPWKENLEYWARHLFKGNLLWSVMRRQQEKDLDKLRNTEEQLKQLKSRRGQFEKNRSLEKSSIELDQTAEQAYLQTVKSVMLAFISDALSKQAKEKLSKQGIDKEDIERLQKEASGLWGALNTIATTFREHPIYWILAPLFLVVTFVLPTVWSKLEIKFVQAGLAQIVSGLVTLAPFIGSVLSWAQKIINFSQENNKIIDGAYTIQQAKQAEEIAHSVRKSPEQKISELQNEISKGSLAGYDALIDLLEAQAETQRQLIGPSAQYTSLMEFVQSRLDAATYENELGLMHQVRQDFLQLATSMVEGARADVFPRGWPRVILYIDDLDRCPPTRVVEILEAVQLLLKTKLFVIIIGLDTRYVTRALEKEYKEILQHEGDPSGLDYIEKIIQIPYRVRPIDGQSLQKYLEAQMDIEPSVEPETSLAVQGQDTSSPTPSSTPNPARTDVQPAAEVTDKIQASDKVTNIATETELTDAEFPKIELPPAVIQFKRKDLIDLTTCCQQISLTPRSVKRVVNVFKLMKIFWFRSESDMKITDRDRPREVKQAAICLLALSSAYPEVMREAFVYLEKQYRLNKVQTELLTALDAVKLPPGTAPEIVWQLHQFKDNLAAFKALKGDDQKLFGQVKLVDFQYSTFNLVRSFSFVGDPVYWTDGDEDTSRANGNRRAKSTARTKRGKKQSTIADLTSNLDTTSGK